MNNEKLHDSFTPVEWRLFRLTAVLFSGVLLAVLLTVIFWGFAAMLSRFYNLLLPLIVAGILALVMLPVTDYVQGKLGIRRVTVITLMFSLFAAALALFLFLLLPSVIQQIKDFIEVAPSILSRLEQQLSRHLPMLSETISLRLQNEAAEELLPTTFNMGATIMQYLGLVTGLCFVPLYLFFALLSGASLRKKVTELLSIFGAETQRRTIYFIDIFVTYVTAFFQGQLLIALIMGILYAIGFTLVGLELSIPLGVVLGLLNVVPFLGTIIGIIIVLPMSYFQPEGGTDLLLLMILVFSVVQFAESWILTPRIMADRSGLHPVLVVISIFFWGIALGGIAGMILAVPLTAFFVTIWSQIKAGLTRSLKQ